MNRIRGYSSPFNLGHRAVQDLFDGLVVVQEKVDGSQFSFGLVNGELVCRSRNQEIIPEAPGMFAEGLVTAQDLVAQGLLREGWTYRGEYLKKPKQNTLAYDRVPRGHIILFDIDRGDQDYLELIHLATVAEGLDLEVVPAWTSLVQPTMEQLNGWLDTESVLGGQKYEGLVFKNYAKYGPDSKVLMGKYVSEKFREKHTKDWKGRHPGGKEFVRMLASEYATEARWDKAVQHLRENDELEGSPRDIGKLIVEVQEDVLRECADEIKKRLFKHYWDQVRRKLTVGLPEWYKERLASEMLGK